MSSWSMTTVTLDLITRFLFYGDYTFAIIKQKEKGVGKIENKTAYRVPGE